MCRGAVRQQFGRRVFAAYVARCWVAGGGVFSAPLTPPALSPKGRGSYALLDMRGSDLGVDGLLRSDRGGRRAACSGAFFDQPFYKSRLWRYGGTGDSG